MIRVQNLESALDFFINKLGMMEVRRREAPEGRFTLVFLATGPGESTIIRSPDQISVELLQEGDPLPPQEPWLSMPSQGEW